MKKSTKIALGLFGVSTIIFIGALSSVDKDYVPPEAPAQVATPNDINTFAMAQLQVKSLLTSPATAKFPVQSNFEDLGDSRYRVTSYVDSQNGFGATVRTPWSLTARYIGGDALSRSSWEFEEFILDGENVLATN